MGTRIVWGALSAMFAAADGLDATIGKPSGYPLWHWIGGEHWEAVRNLSLVVLTLGTAFFGYLAVNTRNGAKPGGSGPESASK